MVSVSLAPFEDSDLDWLLEVEARAREEGLLREHFIMGDTRRDMFVYGLLRSDWERDA